MLFNGGVFKADPLRKRLLGVLGAWAKSAKAEPARELAGADLDLAVARGAAYYGLVRRGKGVRIRGGTARAYYIGVETAMPAVPGVRAADQGALRRARSAWRKAPRPTSRARSSACVVGEPAEFRFLGSTVRRDDAAGTVVEEWEGQIEELAPGADDARRQRQGGPIVPVHLHSKVTEVGPLELWCHSPRRQAEVEAGVQRAGRAINEWEPQEPSDRTFIPLAPIPPARYTQADR